MREYIDINLKVIKKYFKKRANKLSQLNNSSINEEFKEWTKDPQLDKEIIWTLPDLTNDERYKNFCRSIKKKMK